MLLGELLTPGAVRVPLEGDTKDALLAELVRVLAASGAVSDEAEVLRAVRAREAVLSTGVGSGVAIPHAKCDQARTLTMAAGVTRGPVPFDALDGEPVRLLFLLVGPDAEAGQHVKALSRISRLVRRDGFRERLVAAGSADEFLAVVREAEAA